MTRSQGTDKVQTEEIIRVEHMVLEQPHRAEIGHLSQKAWKRGEETSRDY
jgi:hypothetical protein